MARPVLVDEQSWNRAFQFAAEGLVVLLAPKGATDDEVKALAVKYDAVIVSRDKHFFSVLWKHALDREFTAVRIHGTIPRKKFKEIVRLATGLETP
jgi:predicted nuclease of predicted toxin-antitoxin system